MLLLDCQQNTTRYPDFPCPPEGLSVVSTPHIPMYTFFVAHQIFLCVSSLGFVKVILIDQHSTGLISIPAFIEKGLLASILHTYTHIPKTMGLSYIIFNLSTQTYLPPHSRLETGKQICTPAQSLLFI